MLGYPNDQGGMGSGRGGLALVAVGGDDGCKDIGGLAWGERQAQGPRQDPQPPLVATCGPTSSVPSQFPV
jgi:hypothetical protein